MCCQSIVSLLSVCCQCVVRNLFGKGRKDSINFSYITFASITISNCVFQVDNTNIVVISGEASESDEETDGPQQGSKVSHALPDLRGEKFINIISLYFCDFSMNLRIKEIHILSSNMVERSKNFFGPAVLVFRI